MTDDKLSTPGELAGLLRVRVETVRRWINEGRVPAIKVPGGKEWRITAETVRDVTGRKPGG